MKSLNFLLSVIVAGVSVTAWSQIGARGRFIPINPTGVGAAAGYGTEVPGINELGAATGFFTDSKLVVHGFVRAPKGDVIVFDAPGAGKQSVSPGFSLTPVGVYFGQGTYPFSINRRGAIAGYFADTNSVYHGFVRWPNGKFTRIDVEGAGTGEAQGTIVGNINDEDDVTGQYFDAQGAAHAFVRWPDGNVFTFDAPGAGVGSGQGTWACCATSLNNWGELSGWFIDANSVTHGFLRMANGKIIPFEAPGAGTAAGQGTSAWSITPFGEVTGQIVDQKNLSRGYVRDLDGRIRVFDAPGAGTNAYQGTIGEGIAGDGIVVGNYFDMQGVEHGYVRWANGNFTLVNAPQASTVPGQGTIPLSNNSEGKTVGAWFDNNGALHGFLWIPE